MSSLLETSTTQLLQQVARFTERRHEVLTTNVAHATTPGYERQDLDVAGFAEALRGAVEARRNPTPNVVSYGGGPAGEMLKGIARAESAAEIDPEVYVARPDTERHLRSHDAGVRSVETEMTELTKNSMLHNVALQLLTSQFETLQSVISERA